jgi:hypothetical protein
MKAVRGIYEKGAVRLDEEPHVTGRTPVIVTFLEDEPTGTTRRSREGIVAHAAFGLWADRADAADPVAFARELRKKAEARHHAG